MEVLVEEDWIWWNGEKNQVATRSGRTNTNTNTNNLFPPLPMRYNEMHNMISILIKIGTI
jgi:hypothetical protein